MNNKEAAAATDVSENHHHHHVKVFLPKKLLDCLPKCAILPKERLRWNTNEEITSYLITFEKHEEWLSATPRTRPQNGSVILYNRRKVKYRKDGYCWKKRKDGKTTREDHMKLKVQGMECLYGCYVHSSIVPTFHRRCYWLLQNPDIVLVHYLNVPAIEDCGKICGPILCSINSDRKEWLKWSKEDLVNQLKPMFYGIKWTCTNGNGGTEFSIEHLVQQILESHHSKPQPRTHACLCNSSLGTAGNIPHKCSNTKHRIISPKLEIRPCPYPALTEVQNGTTGDNKSETDLCKASSPDSLDGRVSKSVGMASGEVSSTSSHVEKPDSTQNSPVTLTNGYYSDRELNPVTIATSVPNLTVATVTCSLPQNAVILMTGIGDKQLSLGASGLTPSQQLIASEHSSQALPLPSHELALPPSSGAVGLTLLPSSVGQLVLTQNLDPSMETSETNNDFDPDLFLNSPKQGQTYGGGVNKTTLSVSENFSSPNSSEPGTPNCSLVSEVKAEMKKPDGITKLNGYRSSSVPSSFAIFSQSPNSASISQTFPVTTQVSVLSTKLEPSTILEKMDYCNSESPKSIQYSHQHSNQGTANNKPNRFFIQDDTTVQPPDQQATVATPQPMLQATRSPELDIQPVSSNVKDEDSSSVQVLSFRSLKHENEMPMDTSHISSAELKTSQVTEMTPDTTQEDSTTELLGSSKSQEGAEVSDLQNNNLNDLYSIIQNDLRSSPVNSSSIDLVIDHFDLSFDGQLPDLISEFINEVTPSSNSFGQYNSNQPNLVQSVHQHNVVSSNFPPNGPPIADYTTQMHQNSPQFISTTVNCVGYTDITSGNSPQTSADCSIETGQLVAITDFSPEWSYPEGGVKVLITGPWTEDADRYSCFFDKITVPASLIQSGVLRCYCPAHEAGLVTLQVAYDNQLISNSVLFEYRARNSMALPSTQLDWLSLDDNQFRMSILERLEQMEKRMAEMTAASSQQSQQKGGTVENPHVQASSDSFEERIVAVCEKMMSRPCWLHPEHLIHDISFRGMTLLHLAAAQGYARLIETLIRWRTVNEASLDLEQEVDPLNVDHFSCTPLMWACALGHLEAAVILYRWNSQALTIPDSLGRLPLNVARSRGHVRLATCLEELQRQDCNLEQENELRSRQLLQEAEAVEKNWQQLVGVTLEAVRIPSPASASPDTGLSTVSGVSSPSEMSEGSVSMTSAYSSSSALRESPIYSPDDETQQEIAMEITESRQLSLESPTSATPEVKQLVKDESGSSLDGRNHSFSSWYLRDDQMSAKSRSTSLRCCSADSNFFMDYESTLLGSSARSFSTGRDPIEAELLSYTENAENVEFLPAVDVLQQVDMITLAEQIIQATPDRIKQEDFGSTDIPLKERQDNSATNENLSWLASYLENVDELPNFSQHRSLCTEPLTPPTSNTCLSPTNSPLSDISFEKFDPPTTADWSEFLTASANGKMESEFALLTLSDHEQRELYEAARIIQTAFRKYKGRRLKEQQEMAAAVIQRCYRKYKQLTWIALKYALYKKMTQAAILIQSKFRSYYEQKKFQQSRRAAVLIQQYYRSYKEYAKFKQGHRTSSSMQQKMKSSFLTKKQDQAARKIMRFLRRCRHRMKELKQSKELESLQKRSLADHLNHTPAF
ncbi:calmodulin-binding transcription activator 2 isoform X2 [Protopterus annectens]|uniref:calmodulin-binding transcription activator 2 isoform X2 n=1 Tax=Protopterus annectens TaxID=7888 RepID=UPI001CFABFC0|nr:calmodulin-binding transcription activator 2 isoform X2 [Protopterus annectens]